MCMNALTSTHSGRVHLSLQGVTRWRFGLLFCQITLDTVIVTLGLPSFETVIANATASFTHSWLECRNRLVTEFRELKMHYWVSS